MPATTEVNLLVELSRYLSGAIDATSLHETVDNAIDELESVAGSSALDIARHIEHRLSEYALGYLDEARLREILAVEFRCEGSGAPGPAPVRDSVATS